MADLATRPDFASKQRGVLTGMIGGLAASIVVIVGGHFVFPASAPVSDAVPDRLTCYLPYLALMAVPMILAVGGLAKHRFFDPESIDGAQNTSDPGFAARRSVLANHTEQLLMALMVHFALLATLPYGWLNVVPVMALWWTAARLIFAMTYRGGAEARAFGFAATFYPTVTGAIAVPILLVSQAFV
jgi:hypothetical protein